MPRIPKPMTVIKPNFLVVGAAKTGTTSLYDYLKQHPQVFMPTNETLFFYLSFKN